MSTSARKKAARQRQHQLEKAERQRAALFQTKPAKRKTTPNVQKNSKYRETPAIPSNESAASPHATAKREPTFYTGDFVIGLSTLHKSNLVPVTRDDDPIIFAKMRR